MAVMSTSSRFNAPLRFIRCLVHRTRFRTRAEAKTALFEYIEIFYNCKRSHSALDYRTPVQARTDMVRDLGARSPDTPGRLSLRVCVLNSPSHDALDRRVILREDTSESITCDEVVTSQTTQLTTQP